MTSYLQKDVNIEPGQGGTDGADTPSDWTPPATDQPGTEEGGEDKGPPTSDPKNN